ncbi:coiled-coil domain-containing protein 137 [Cimex lectularius]|uniref:Coiled-coil domain-containing protein 137 n=1 Tax=Cimex lectularius TaxID=79782 RepID=A0A8I6R7N9_CIMLE|nr:coiled-coil domain-containing protein 137 [Cimex lectularius]
MGRKIPGKKHRGIKDPHEQQSRRNEQLKNKINAAPLNPDEQEVPKSFIEISRPVSTKENVVTYPKLPHFAANDTSDIMNLSEDKLLPLMEQKAGESEEHFLDRIQSATDELMDEAQMEAKFNVKVKRNKYGHVEKVEMGKSNNTDNMPEAETRKRSKKKVPETENKVKRLSKRKRNKLKKTAQQEPISDVKYDKVKFGEVVHEPPNFKKLPRGVEGHKSKGKNLLLNSFLGGDQKPSRNINVSMSMKQKLEKQRKEVVAAYRLLKASKGNYSKM